MKQKIEKDKREISPRIGVILMVLITIILLAIIGCFVFGMGVDINQYYKIQTEEHSNKDFLSVKVLNYANNSPLPNVTIKVLEHGEGRLLSGPYITNESGYTIIQIPHGYDDHFDIIGEYKNVTNTITIDKRSSLVRAEDVLGSLGIELVILFIALAAGVVGWFLRGWKLKKAPETDEVKEKSEENINSKHNS